MTKDYDLQVLRVLAPPHEESEDSQQDEDQKRPPHGGPPAPEMPSDRTPLLPATPITSKCTLQAHELAFATALINQVTAGLPAARLGLHVCRGNWTRDETVALAGDYRPLLPVFERLSVGTLLLELCTPRAGDLAILKMLPSTVRLGVGVVNQKQDRIETVTEIVGRARRAIDLVGPERVVLTPDCGFATFADNPVASPVVAEAKLRAIVDAAVVLRTGR
jgi:5-methyltetrahydropteroyltriglutamate--homocysteine methyltransferase